jgi:hypothetical protein
MGVPPAAVSVRRPLMPATCAHAPALTCSAQRRAAWHGWEHHKPRRRRESSRRRSHGHGDQAAATACDVCSGKQEAHHIPAVRGAAAGIEPAARARRASWRCERASSSARAVRAPPARVRSTSGRARPALACQHQARPRAVIAAGAHLLPAFRGAPPRRPFHYTLVAVSAALP